MFPKTEQMPNAVSSTELFELSNDAVLIIDGSGHILDANSRATDLFGYEKAEFKDMPVFHLHPENEHLKSKEHFQQMLQEHFHRFSIGILTKKGHRREVEVSASLTEKPEGLFAIFIVRDVTDQKEAYRKINQLSQFPEQNPNPVIRTDKYYRLEYANEASSALLNNLSINIGDYLPHDWQTQLEEICKNDGCSNKRQNFEYRIGERFYLFTVSSIAQTGQVYFYGQDITSLKTYQEKLQATNEELNTFIYKTHHDLKNPLSSLLGLLQLAETEITDETALSYLDMIHQSAGKLDNILTTLIKTIEIKDGKKKLEQVHLNSLLEEIFNRSKLVKGADQLKFDYQVNEEVQTIKTDKNVLTSILENLVTNAIKYKDESKEEQWVRIRVDQFDNGVVFQVADNGQGIDPDVRDLIFKMFYRANKTPDGTGLGLFLVKKGVEKLEGTIDVTSEKAQGSTFEITIPNALTE